MLKWIVILGCFCFLGCSSSKPEPLIIGHLSFVSDPSEFQAIQTMLDTLPNPSSSGLLNRPIRIIHSELGKSPDESHAQAVRLLNINNVSVLLGSNRVETSKRIAEAGASESIPTISLASHPGPITKPNLFSVGLSPRDEGFALAKWAHKEGKKVLVVVDEEDWLLTQVAKFFAESLRESNKTSVIQQEFQRSSISGMVSRASQLAPDIILLAIPPEDVISWCLEQQKSNLQGAQICFGGQEVDLTTLIHNDKHSFQIIAATSFSPQAQEGKIPEFVKQYSERYQKEPTLEAALAYDALSIIIQGVQQTGSIQGSRLRESFLSPGSMLDCLSGPARFDSDQSLHRTAYIVGIQSGNVKLLKSIPWEVSTPK